MEQEQPDGGEHIGEKEGDPLGMPENSSNASNHPGPGRIKGINRFTPRVPMVGDDQVALRIGGHPLELPRI